MFGFERIDPYEVGVHKNVITGSVAEGVQEQGLRYLNWRYFDVLRSAADGRNNMVVVPVTERGVPLFFSPGMNTRP